MFCSSAANFSSVDKPAILGSGFLLLSVRTILSVAASTVAGRSGNVSQYDFVRQGISSGSRVIISRLKRTFGLYFLQVSIIRGRSNIPSPNGTSDKRNPSG